MVLGVRFPSNAPPLRPPRLPMIKSSRPKPRAVRRPVNYEVRSPGRHRTVWLPTVRSAPVRIARWFCANLSSPSGRVPRRSLGTGCSLVLVIARAPLRANTSRWHVKSHFLRPASIGHPHLRCVAYRMIFAEEPGAATPLESDEREVAAIGCRSR